MDLLEDKVRLITKFKLNLVQAHETNNVQTGVEERLQALRANGAIKRNTDIFRLPWTPDAAHA